MFPDTHDLHGVTLELDEDVEKTTDMAILISVGGEEYWLPRSQVHSTNDVDANEIEEGETGPIVVTRWWARKTGLS